MKASDAWLSSHYLQGYPTKAPHPHEPLYRLRMYVVGVLDPAARTLYTLRIGTIQVPRRRSLGKSEFLLANCRYTVSERCPYGPFPKGNLDALSK
jgi:hypothetical protein